MPGLRIDTDVTTEVFEIPIVICFVQSCDGHVLYLFLLCLFLLIPTGVW